MAWLTNATRSPGRVDARCEGEVVAEVAVVGDADGRGLAGQHVAPEDLRAVLVVAEERHAQSRREAGEGGVAPVGAEGVQHVQRRAPGLRDMQRRALRLREVLDTARGFQEHLAAGAVVARPHRRVRAQHQQRCVVARTGLEGAGRVRAVAQPAQSTCGHVRERVRVRVEVGVRVAGRQRCARRPERVGRRRRARAAHRVAERRRGHGLVVGDGGIQPEVKVRRSRTSGGAGRHPWVRVVGPQHPRPVGGEGHLARRLRAARVADRVADKRLRRRWADRAREIRVGLVVGVGGGQLRDGGERHGGAVEADVERPVRAAAG